MSNLNSLTRWEVFSTLYFDWQILGGKRTYKWPYLLLDKVTGIARDTRRKSYNDPLIFSAMSED
ncbi:hypothetical protein Clacol_005068 [Clathrus columnatus]|uniref:Uncharacterized protein n=1 Tax=Clathrus columnatus TaxID=1419009 RepID=A0AAV5AFX4_9AGAM|nr:hypothetical protein Clacol_005068 [Clathrus columnatus]